MKRIKTFQKETLIAGRRPQHPELNKQSPTTAKSPDLRREMHRHRICADIIIFPL